MKNFLFRKETPESDVAATKRFAEILASKEKHLVRNYSAFGARKVDETRDGPVVEAIAVSEGVKRDGSTISVKGIDLTGLRANPVLMFGHRYDQPPIGRIVDMRKSSVDGLGKVLKIRFSPLKSQVDTEHRRFADSIFDMLVQGDLRTVSFGWRTVEAEPLKDEQGYHTGWNFTRTDAMEVSVVPVPADADAMVTNIRERGLDPARFVISRDAGSSVYEVRETIPEAFDLTASTVDEEIETIEVRTSEVPTEEKKEESTVDIEKYLKDIMGRFAALEQRIDEMPVVENRKGAVLNAANRKALTDAMQLIGAVVKNAGDPQADSGGGSGTAAAKPEAVLPPEKREEVQKVEAQLEVKFEDVAEIRDALKAKREGNALRDLLGELALKTAKTRSKVG